MAFRAGGRRPRRGGAGLAGTHAAGLPGASLLGAVTLSVATLCGCAPSGPVLRAGSTAPPAPALARLPGWQDDQLAEAEAVLKRGCARLAMAPPEQSLGGGTRAAGRGGIVADWAGVCAAARALPAGDERAARSFFETRFDLVPLTDPARPSGLFTGYYEPEIRGSRQLTRTYHVAVLSKPADLVEQVDDAGRRHFGRIEDGQLVPYYTRAEIDAGALRRQRLDLLYLANPIDLFFLQIQGAGRIDLPNGHMVRVGYAATNGQPYVPIGRVLSERGELAPDAISALSIRAWLESHPRAARGVMEQNPAYTFFREVADLSPDSGPLGTLGVQLTPLRSIAVDPSQIPLAAPVWIDTTDADGQPIRRMMIAQDTGSGVKGVLRADIFYGWGSAAAGAASRLQAAGRAWLLLPKSSPGS